MIEIWESITKIIRYCERFPKSKKPSSKSYFKAQEAANDKFIIAKTHFFSFFGSIFKAFLTNHQTRWAMAPFMYDDFKKLVKNILQLYIKQRVIDNCSNGIAYKNTKSLNKSNIASKKISHLVVLLNLSLLKKDSATSLEIEAFKTESFTFLIPTTQKIFEPSPLGQQLFVIQVL